MNEKYILVYEFNQLINYCRLGNITEVRKLLQKGENPNVKSVSDYGETPLHAVIIGPQTDRELIKVLVDNGALMTRDHLGMTPLDKYREYVELYLTKDEAELKKRNEIISLLEAVTVVESPTDIFECVIKADKEGLKKILDTEILRINWRNMMGYSPLGECIYQMKRQEHRLRPSREAYLDCFKILIEKGADVNFVSNCGGHQETPLMLAIGDDNFEVVELLLKAGADPKVLPEEMEELLSELGDDESGKIREYDKLFRKYSRQI